MAFLRALWTEVCPPSIRAERAIVVLVLDGLIFAAAVVVAYYLGLLIVLIFTQDIITKSVVEWAHRALAVLSILGYGIQGLRDGIKSFAKETTPPC